MDKTTRDRIIETAMRLEPTLALYVELHDVTDEEQETYGNTGAFTRDGVDATLICQSETECIYGIPTDDIDEADYLIGDCLHENPIHEMLDAIFGDQSEWPDSYAQTHGWNIPAEY